MADDITPRGNAAGTDQTLSMLAATVADYAALLAAGRAAVAAAAAGENDPLAYVRDLLADRGQLPPSGARPLAVLADARSALNLAAGAGLSGPARTMAFRLTWAHCRAAEFPRPFRPDADTPLTPASGDIRPDEPSWPIAARCGCVLDFPPGSAGGGGPMTLAVSCGQHEGWPHLTGLYRVAWPDHPRDRDSACPGCVGRGTGTRCWMCGGQIPATLRRDPADPPEVRADCADCATGRTHAHEAVSVP